MITNITVRPKPGARKDVDKSPNPRVLADIFRFNNCTGMTEKIHIITSVTGTSLIKKYFLKSVFFEAGKLASFQARTHSSKIKMQDRVGVNLVSALSVLQRLQNFRNPSLEAFHAISCH